LEKFGSLVVVIFNILYVDIFSENKIKIKPNIKTINYVTYEKIKGQKM
jgi:hypothetical protein